MKLADYLRLPGLLLRLRHEQRAGSGPQTLPSTNRVEGCDVDIYVPGRPRGGAVLAVHGLTLDGGRDARLMGFARALAGSGVTCFVPTLPALSDGRLQASDLDVLQAVVRRSARDADRALCLVGFSIGASYALCVAAREAVQPELRAVLSFGAAHDLNALLCQSLETLRFPGDDESLDVAIFTALVLVRSAEPRLGGEELQLRVREILKGYCERPLPEKRRFFEAHLAGLPLLEAFERARAQGDWAALSPSGHMDSLKVPVSLIHDRRDPLVPSSHAEALSAELAGHPSTHVWITGAVSHVKSARTGLGDLLPMLRALAPLVA